MNRRGVTLVEMVIVVAIVGLIAGLAAPGLSTGLDTIRLAQASDSIAAFLNSALTRAQRRQQPVEVTIAPGENALVSQSVEPASRRRLAMPSGVTITAVLPRLAAETNEARRFVLLPGGAIPRLGVEIANQRGSRRVVAVDPITGVPRVVAP
ncbi:MAG: pilus assembly FimT family protein [Bryobacteraceae bacterium]